MSCSCTMSCYVKGNCPVRCYGKKKKHRRTRKNVSSMLESKMEGNFEEAVRTKGYNIEEEIASGEFGIAYLVSKAKKYYIIKKLNNEDNENNVKIDYLLEKHILRRIQSVCKSGLICFKEAWSGNDYYAIVVSSPKKTTTLLNYINEKKELSFAKKLVLIYNICTGLSALHALSITHRDIKLNNICIDLVKFRAYLIDFGLSIDSKNRAVFNDVAMNERMNQRTNEHDYEYLGTLEQDDIYALGLVCLTILCWNTNLNYDDIGLVVDETTLETILKENSAQPESEHFLPILNEMLSEPKDRVIKSIVRNVRKLMKSFPDKF